MTSYLLLTWPGAVFAVLSGLIQALAYWLCYGRKVSELERRGIGVVIIAACFTLGILLDDRANPVVALWHTVGWSGLATWLCYRYAPRVQAGETPEADALLRRIDAELSDPE